MQYESLSGSELKISRVGLGCNNFGRVVDVDATRSCVDAALDEGINHLDTADIYGADGASERHLGQVLGHRRDKVVLATKAGMDLGEGWTSRGSREYMRFSVERSLRRLATDRIDLFYFHEPDPTTPIAETLGALDEMIEEGKIRAIACSNFSAQQLREADAVSREQGTARFIAVQNHYSLLNRDDEKDVIPACEELGIAYIPFFPLASGLLTGKYRRGEERPAGTRLEDAEVDEETFDRIEALQRFAEERGHTVLELAISALASQPAIPSVIAGATKPAQVQANAAAGSWQLDEADLKTLSQL